MIALKILGVLWALPISLLGFLMGALALPFGAKLQRSEGGLIFHCFPLGPGGAMTLGNVVLNTHEHLETQVRTYVCRAHGGDDCVRIGTHERAHIYQYMLLGPFFLPLYFLCGGISHKNPLERAADVYAMTGKGWWPWWPHW